ncbi:peptidylprolyl isomerase [Aquabacterium sp.]|uniref:peptidylprolyl isomerase n=1 Tax=Aquabacterium sp. TaxID=1872578 RepID=UPI002BA1A658|nr:peptidylprolyl isomerase [Aquabacterium sp.]HSW03140.1 peptidylprolyl isomerase [Aquabacterium sp.]
MTDFADRFFRAGVRRGRWCVRQGSRFVLALGAAALLLPALAQTPQTPRVARNGDYIVAVVNTELVTAVEVEQRLVRTRADAQRGGARLPAEEALRKQVLDSLIDERVQSTYARESGARIDDVELDRAVANIASQNQLTPAQLRDRVKADGMDYTRFRNNLRDQMMVERVREREVTSRIRISDADIDRVLDQQRAEAAGDQELNLAQILITVPEGANDAVVAQRRALMDQVVKRARAGEDFGKLARELSEDGNRAAGGEIGLRPQRRLPDLFVDATRGVAAGQVIAQPVRSSAGFHLLKVLARQDGDAFKVTQTHARHILMRVTDRSSVQAVSTRLEQLRRQVERNERKFEDLARELSEDGTAPQGGDLGWTSPGSFVPEFEEAMNKLPIGAISAPVVSRFGVHLIQVTERRNVTQDPKEVRDQARNMLREQKFEQAYIDWTKDLRLRAYIEMREPPQ